jgi:glycine/D-amino acid oxidase-like deaminating enzyme
MNDAVVIGGGFYGAAISIYLAKQRGFSKVVLIEREHQLLMRASYNNQARVHNGYHYPRSFTTAYRSRVNSPRFIRDYPEAIKQDFTKLYAIARNNSKINAKQFEHFCREIGAKLKPAEKSLSNLFEPRLIEQVFLVEEYAFDSTQLMRRVKLELDEAGVEIRLNTSATGINKAKDSLTVTCTEKSIHTELNARFVFNCAYSGLNQLQGDFPGTKVKLKHEITEMALILPPPALRDLGITVMDGPFFSMMPFPALNLHTLSHVRYTPHLQWADDANLDPYQKLCKYDHSTRVNRMIRDTARYMPSILEAQYIDSIFETKTILIKNEGDDGRPILFEQHPELPRCYSILGGKIDNIYDVIKKLDGEPLLTS